ncbi:MAG: F0F1 ATP synthase subunit alpha, partial [Eubacteriales bacterium]|nr:F0F1 ATP synthase subunit alpha [Eubacteriales bacterium]
GQIFLETELFNSGVMPAVNPGISVSRVGGDAQIKAMKKVAGSLKLLYSQYRELQSFAQFGSDLDADTKARLALGERIVAVLKQKNNSPKEVAQQVCIIYAVTHGYLAAIAVEDIPEFEKRLEEHMENLHPQVLEAIRSTGKLETETENALKSAIEELVPQFTA